MEKWTSLGLYLFAAYGLLTLVLSGLEWLRRGDTLGAKPLVGLVLLVKDKESLVEGLVRSVMNLNYITGGVNCEVVVVDDRSRDGTLGILERLALRYQQLRVVSMEDVQNSENALEVGFFLCRSPIVLVCDMRGTPDYRHIVRTLFYILGGKNLKVDARMPVTGRDVH